MQVKVLHERQYNKVNVYHTVIRHGAEMDQEKNYRLKHARGVPIDETVSKKIKITPWQCFMKEYGKSEGDIVVFHTIV